MDGVEGLIKAAIMAKGRITFDEFMDVALYTPLLGYYTSGVERVRAEGDFYTSPVTHPVFGALIAIQLEQMWHALGSPRPFYAIEMGSGKGLLEHDVLSYSGYLSDGFQRALVYVALDRHLGTHSMPSQDDKDPVRSYSVQAERLPLRGIVGCFLSNEFFDSLPTHLVVRQGSALKEVYVALDGESFVEVIDEPSTPMLQQQLDEVGVTLAEGCRGEVNLRVRGWVEEIAKALQRGFVLTIDYGHHAQELYFSTRPRGTLMCYYRHTNNENPYIRVGRQDITAHVDFTNLNLTGQRHGLHSLGFVTQADFLTNLGIDAFIAALSQKGLAQGESFQRKDANLRAMRELVLPEGFGRFRVLIQGKGVGDPKLDGLQTHNPTKEQLLARIKDLEVPLLTGEHIPLLAGKYPHLAWDWEEGFPSES